MVADSGATNVRRSGAKGELEWCEVDDLGVDVDDLAGNLICDFVEFNAARFGGIGFEMIVDANFLRRLHGRIFIGDDDLHEVALLTFLNKDVAKEESGIGLRVVLKERVLVCRKADESDSPRFVGKPSVKPAQVRFLMDIGENVDLCVKVGALF